MANAQIPTALTSDFNTNNTVTLLVGPKQHSMTANGPYLRRRSDFFAAALKKQWNEGRSRIVVLPEVSPEMMAHYLAHVYSAVLPIHLFNRYSLDARAVSGYELLAELYVLGERMLDSSIRKSVVKHMV